MNWTMDQEFLLKKYFRNKTNAIFFIEKNNSSIEECGVVPNYYILASYEGEVDDEKVADLLDNGIIKYED